MVICSLKNHNKTYKKKLNERIIVTIMYLKNLKLFITQPNIFGNEIRHRVDNEAIPSFQLPWDMIRRRAMVVSRNCCSSNSNNSYILGALGRGVSAMSAEDWFADHRRVDRSTAAAATAGRAANWLRYVILNNNNSSNNNKANQGVWGMTKTGVEGAEGWRGRTQRRTTLFTSRDGWDSSVGWL